jgi:hypothetical protein
MSERRGEHQGTGEAAVKFRKKPVVIEAIQNSPGMAPPMWLQEAMQAGIVRVQPGGGFAIDTLEGTMIARPDDWIIRGVKGELYPCKPIIFAATYENGDRAPTPLEEIAVERKRQIEEEGFTAERDDGYADRSLASAAACYAMAASQDRFARELVTDKEVSPQNLYIVRCLWPRGWSWKWWKPTTHRRDLVKAAALIVAEIERLDRAATKEVVAQGDANA